jgi:hypothetical protein
MSIYAISRLAGLTPKTKFGGSRLQTPCQALLPTSCHLTSSSCFHHCIYPRATVQDGIARNSTPILPLSCPPSIQRLGSITSPNPISTTSHPAPPSSTISHRPPFPSSTTPTQLIFPRTMESTTSTSPPSRRSIYWTLGCIYGASAVMLGAFGAHGLKKRIADPQRIANFGTAAQYQVSLVRGWVLLFPLGWTGWGGWLLFVLSPCLHRIRIDIGNFHVNTRIPSPIFHRSIFAMHLHPHTYLANTTCHVYSSSTQPSSSRPPLDQTALARRLRRISWLRE